VIEEKRKMDPPIKSEDDRVWVAENDRVWVMTISIGLHAPRWINLWDFMLHDGLTKAFKRFI
jgi:hypothetical protein